jgi:hypothetical protein
MMDVEPRQLSVLIVNNAVLHTCSGWGSKNVSALHLAPQLLHASKSKGLQPKHIQSPMVK